MSSYCAHVTYFVRDIAAFVGKLTRAARRRVVIHVNARPPVNASATIFGLVFNEPQALVPSSVDLMNVLEELTIKPEVISFDPPAQNAGRWVITGDRKVAIELVATLPQLRRDEEDRVRAVLDDHFDELFSAVESGFVPTFVLPSPTLLITWET